MKWMKGWTLSELESHPPEYIDEIIHMMVEEQEEMQRIRNNAGV